MKRLAGWFWGFGLVATLGGCESRPTARTWWQFIAPDPIEATPEPVTAASPVVRPETPAASRLTTKITTRDLEAEKRAAQAEEDTLAALRREKLRAGQLGYHRYRGRVGGRPVVVELTVAYSYAGAAAQCEGQYYDSLAGQVRALEVRHFWPRRSLQVQEADTAAHLNTWLTNQPLGPVLTGRWRAAGGRQLQPFSLREDYRGGVRYALRTTYREDPPLPPEVNADGDTVHNSFTPSFERTYLHLLGPDARRPALRRLQALLARPDIFNEGGCQDIETVDVLLNDFGLLSEAIYFSSYMRGSAHPQHESRFNNFDLRTGRRFGYDAVFRPGYGSALRKMAFHYIDANYMASVCEWWNESEHEVLKDTELPETFGLTPDGWLIKLTLGPYVMGDTNVLVPYAKLLPLLRPDSPVARMLHERNLWPKAVRR